MKGKYLLLGTNLGNRLQNLKTAEKLLEADGISILRKSSVYVSEPWGVKEQPWFLNRVLEVETTLTSAELLSRILRIEVKMGRIRKIKWGERLIDIDILYNGGEVVNTERLKVPHPEIANRRFTLLPLAELEADGLDPVKQKRISQLLDQCPDNLSCEKLEQK